VQDALDYIPAYDQRAYSQALKALTEKLNEATGKFAPKSRFQFKPRKAVSAPAAAPDARDLRQVLPSRAGASTTGPTAATTSAAVAASKVSGGVTGQDKDETGDELGQLPRFGAPRNYNAEMAAGTTKTANSEAEEEEGPPSAVRKPSFSTAKNIAIYAHTGLHIILPSSASRATSSGSLTRLERCVVDMTVPTTRVPPTSPSGTAAPGGVPFAGLAIKDARRCLLICGTVAGPVHVTGVRDSVVVVAARQVRVHECENVDLYLHCGSHPIIEDCKGMRFAPLPDVYASISPLLSCFSPNLVMYKELARIDWSIN
jgi:tubulin-specific chaperone C